MSDNPTNLTDPDNPSNKPTIPSVSITASQTGASTKANELCM